MKKIGILLCLSSTLFAAAAAQAGCCENGNWLVGVSGGWAWHSDRDVNVAITGPGTAFNAFSVANDDDRSNFIWGILAGYQARVNGWLLGGEVNVDWRNHDDNDQSFTAVVPAPIGTLVGTASGNNHNNAVVGLTARIGYEVSSFFMPYIRLGAEVTRTDDVNFTVSRAAAPAFTAVYNNDRNHRWGFVGGVGAEFPVPMCKTLSLRAEYDYHSHSRHDDVAVLASDLGTLFTVSGDGHRHENTGKLALVYNFI